MLSRLIAAMAIVAAPSVGQAEAPEGFDIAILEGCLAQATLPEGCIGAAAGACIAIQGGQVGAGPCYGAEAAWWEGRIAAAMDRLAPAGAEAEAFAERVGWPVPRPSLASLADAFEAHRQAACDMAGALQGGGSGAGPAWIACRMRMAAEEALRLESWAAAQ